MSLENSRMTTTSAAPATMNSQTYNQSVRYAFVMR